jgi:RHH-type rel operon transcriptional repressor/antitoxin RelB
MAPQRSHGITTSSGLRAASNRSLYVVRIQSVLTIEEVERVLGQPDTATARGGGCDWAMLEVLYMYSNRLPSRSHSSRLTMLAIRLPEDIEARLDTLAKRTGRSKTFYVREAILQHLDELEDLYLAERMVKRIQAGKEQTLTLDEVEARLGLAD